MKATPFLSGLVSGAIGFLGTCIWGTWAIFQSTSSTAAIGLVFLPIQALKIAVPFYLFGYCAHHAVAALRPPRHSLKGLLAAGVALAILLPFLHWLGNGLVLSYVARDVRAMAPSQIVNFLKASRFKENKYALNALLEHQDLDAQTLYQIAQIPSPELHDRMGSFFPMMGKNTKGLAVMRLVARHPNADARTLALLANSPNDYVLGDVALNKNTPADIVVRLHKKGGYLIDWGVASNPNCPPEILHELSSSDNEYTRASVAGNSSTSPADLERLAHDSKLRYSVMMNPNCPPALKKTLRNAFDERVRRRSQ